MSDKSNSSSGGIGFVGLLTIVFITLKLIDKIDWSWWWVLSPIWISIGLTVGVLICVGLIYAAIHLIAWLADTVKARKRRKNLRRVA